MKACIFDMDGVLIDSERGWESPQGSFLETLVGKEIMRKIGDIIGMSIANIYRQAVKAGYKESLATYYQRYNRKALEVFKKGQLATGLIELINWCNSNNIKIGILSSSPRFWIDLFLRRITWKESIRAILSVNDDPKIRAKPAPDGYLQILRDLGVSAKDAIAIEDSNFGIQAAKAAGIFTIAYREFLSEGYLQKGADAEADTMLDVLSIFKQL